MSLIGPWNILAGASNPTGYTIDQSLRCDQTKNGYLSWTPSSAGNRRTWTLSLWVKRGNIGQLAGVNNYPAFAGSEIDANTRDTLRFYGSNDYGGLRDGLMFEFLDSGVGADPYSEARFRDPASWYHVVYAIDTTQATAVNRCKIYVNGEGPIVHTSGSLYPAQNRDCCINSTAAQLIGARFVASLTPFDGYMADVHFIDGQALTPSDFAETNDDLLSKHYGQWLPKKYAGTYGSNGYRLNFSDSSALGADTSGNGNNFSVTNYVATDQVLDSPSNNFCVLNQIAIWNGTVQEANLKTNGAQEYCGTMSYPDTGKWYYEVCFVTDSASYEGYVGVGASTDLRSASWVYGNYGILLCKDDGTASTRASGGIGSVGSNTGTGSQWVDGDVLQVLVDLDSSPNTFQVKKNNGGTALVAYEFTWAGIDFGPYGGILFPMIYTNNAAVKMVANFGVDSSFAANKTAQGNSDSNAQGDFYYEPPAGYLALCSNNLVTNASISRPELFYNTVLYTGNGATGQSITGVGFQPDLVWLKASGMTSNNNFFDSMRGATKRLIPNSTGAEDTLASFASFDSDGFTLDDAPLNDDGSAWVAWCWKANGGTPVTNDDGNITTSISANTTAGFSIGTYTGESSSGTLGHGLTKKPEFVLIKRRDSAGTWIAWHGLLGASWSFVFNTDGASSNNGWSGGTKPTDSLIHVANNSDVNGNTYTYVFYAWHSVPGLTKVGTYYGGYDGSDPYNQNFCPTGFEPAFILIKKDAGSAAWQLFDNKRLGYNIDNNQLYPNSNAVQGTSDFIDIVSNGFKVRTNDSVVGAVATYAYIAFASNPLEGADAR